ncbi:LPS assembly lipoprotein LptE [Chitinibacter sp. GC72]|uniref:LPS-assembly lipoprotein LptE n=1 Tax=Chitinibacter sp. GC72 TaxID=1526917 RepID=UPI0012F88AF7|nr:LPS assembly lipoprotein LptE [Chitinibacter sp. GC72]
MPLHLRTLLAALLSLSLMACGFHLRGQGPNSTLPFASAKLIGNGGAFQDLSRQLGLMKINLNSPTPEITIQILSEGMDKQVLSVNSSGQVAEYRLYYRLHFSASKVGETLIDDHAISLQRNISWDENSVLSKEAEEASLIREMQRDAAGQIIRRINAAAKNAGNTSAANSSNAAGQ